MTKIKIFVDGHWFDDLYQSPCIFLKGLYKELQYDERFEIYIAAANVDQLKAVFDRSSNIKYVPYESKSKYYRLAFDVLKLIKKHKIDIAHYQYVSPLFKTTREIVTIHDILFKDFTNLFPWSYRTSKNFLFQRSAKRADLVTTVSKYSAEAIQKHYKIPSEKLVVIPNGISSEFFTEYPEGSLPDISQKYGLKNFILYVSRVEPRKNHIALLKAYVNLELWKQNIKLVLIGRTDIRIEAVETYLAQLPDTVKDNIVMLKDINFAELLSFYRQALIFVYPSIAEGFGIPPLEAASLKTPTLCSRTTSMADYSFFEDDLFDPYDPLELSEKIKRKLTNDDVQRRGEISDLIRKKYNWKNISSNFANSILSVFDN